MMKVSTMVLTHEEIVSQRRSRFFETWPLYVDESFRKLNAGTIESHPPNNRTCLEQINLAILYENAPDFVELINNLPSDDLEEELDYILTSLFLWDSGKCAVAVLDGLTKIPEIPLETSSVSHLHQSAVYSAYKITALLLRRGFSADVRGDYDGMPSAGMLKNALPLHVVMKALRFHLRCNIKEEVEEPLAVMLVRLCRTHYRRMLETLRLIAVNTTEVKREFFNYLKEGKMIEVGALLLVAKSHILSPSTTVNEEGEFRSISEIHDFVLNTIRQLNALRRLKTPFELTKSNELVEMEKTLELLEIIVKIGDKLAALLRLDFSQTCLANCSTLLPASLIEDAGYDANYFYYGGHFYFRSKAESYYLKEAIDACENSIRISDVPIWVKEAALAGSGVKPDRYSRLTYPFLAGILPMTSIVRPASTMPENMTPLCHLLKKTAPF